MPTKKIIVADAGTQVSAEVDLHRYNSFDSLRSDQRFAGILGDARMQGLDAGEAMAFLVSQLAYTESQLFERMYTPMQYEQFLPMDFSAGEWADSIRYEVYDFAGQGKRTSGKGHDINKVDIAFAEKTFAVVNGNIGYDYSQEELRRTAYMRRALPDRKLAAAMEAYKRHMNKVGLYGEAESGLTGLFNNALVPQGTAPSATSWNTATADQMLTDLNTLIQNVWSNTAYNDMPDTVIIAPAPFAKIASTARSANSDKTILSFLKENNVAKQQRGVNIDFQPGFGLNTAGAGSTRRMMAYVKSPQRLVMHIPLPLRFLAPQMVGLAVDVPGEYKYSGVEIRYPKSAFYMDGI